MGSSWRPPWMMGRVPSPSISCSSTKKTFAQGRHESATARTANPRAGFHHQHISICSTRPNQTGQTGLGAQGAPSATASWWALCMAQPSWHTARTDPGISKSQRTELPQEFAVWAVGVTDRPEEQEGERLNSTSMQTAGLLLQTPLVPGLCLGPSAAIAWGSQSKGWPSPAAQGICQAAAK